MTPSHLGGLGPVRGVVDPDGRLVEADARLLDLQIAAGGRLGGMLAIPQVAALVRLSKRLGVPVSRGVIAADENQDFELWVKVMPEGDRILLEISGWNPLAAKLAPALPTAQREADFARAAADWIWETDEGLRLTVISAHATAVTGKAPGELVGKPLTSLFRFREYEDGSLPILTAMAERRRFDGQLAEIRSEVRTLYRLDGVPLVDGAGRFAGFRGSATRADDENIAEPPPDVSVAASLRESLDQIISHAEKMEVGKESAVVDNYVGYAADISSAGRHLLSLVDDLSDLQAIEHPEFKIRAAPIDLALIARQAATFLAVRAAERRVRLAAPQHDSMLPALGDHRRALQIVVNLIGNAIRYSP